MNGQPMLLFAPSANFAVSSLPLDAAIQALLDSAQVATGERSSRITRRAACEKPSER